MSHIQINRIPISSAQEIVDFVNSDFAKTEPLCESLGTLVSEFNDVIVLRTVQMGMSFEAIDTSDGNKRIGVFLSAPCKRGEKSSLDLELETMEIDDQMEKISGVLDYAKSLVMPVIHEKYQQEEYLEGVIMSVLSGYGGQGVAKRMLAAVEEMTREIGIKVIYIGCTSEYSARVVAKSGYQEVHSVIYDEYKLDGVQVFHTKPPHDALRAYIKLLED